MFKMFQAGNSKFKVVSQIIGILAGVAAVSKPLFIIFLLKIISGRI